MYNDPNEKKRKQQDRKSNPSFETTYESSYDVGISSDDSSSNSSNSGSSNSDNSSDCGCGNCD